MFQTIASTFALVALVWAFGGRPAHAWIIGNGGGINGFVENGTRLAGSTFAIDGIELAPPAR